MAGSPRQKMAAIFTSPPGVTAIMNRVAITGLSLVLGTLLLAGCASKKTTEQAGATTGNTTTITRDDNTATDTDGADAGSVTTDAVYGGGGVAAGPRQGIVYFAFDSSVIDQAGIETLRSHATTLKASGAKVRLEGHADERGTPEYNIALGQRRADAARSLFVSLGVKAAQVETVSYGEMKPAVDGEEEAAWAQNRRVEIFYPGAR